MRIAQRISAWRYRLTLFRSRLAPVFRAAIFGLAMAWFNLGQPQALIEAALNGAANAIASWVRALFG
jgi:hypothetical protein